jgi:hypothetical protein
MVRYLIQIHKLICLWQDFLRNEVVAHGVYICELDLCIPAFVIVSHHASSKMAQIKAKDSCLDRSAPM